MRKYLSILIFIAITFIFGLSGCLSTKNQNPTTDETVQSLILQRKFEEARIAFQKQKDINETDINGNTVLHAAAKVNNGELVTFFISMGASTELKNNESDTPLHVAIKNDSVEAAEILAAVNSDIFARDAVGKTALELGIEKGQLFFSAMITTRTGELRDNAGQSIIHYFVKNLNTAAIDYAILKKIPIDTPDLKGITPLSIALNNDKNNESIKIAVNLLLAGSTPTNGKYSYFEKAIIARNPSIRFEDGQTPLHLSSIQNHTGITTYLLARGASVTAQDISGATPLHESIRYGNIENARLLINAGANVNAQDNLGKTPILLIVPQERQTEIYSLLIASGANINAKDMYGDTVLHIATLNGADTEIIQQFINHNADINERNKEGATPLSLAVEHQKTALIQFYAQNGADIHAEDKEGNTPLTLALKLGNDLTTKLLNDSTIYLRDSNGNTPLHLAVLNVSPTTSVETPEEKAKTENLLATLDYMIGLNPEINVRNKNGDTPLSIAAMRNAKKTGEYLLSRDADIFSTNNDDYSPLRIALESDSKDWLLTSQVIKATDGSGNTPLHYCAEWGLTDAISLLVEKGSNPNAKNANGETPIYNAVKVNNPEIVTILAQNGANCDTRDYLGNTPVHACIRWDSLDSIYALINAGCSMDARNLAGKTPLAEAARAGKIEMVTLLLNYGADINATDETGKTVLIDAIQSGNTDLVKLLLEKGASPLIQEMYGRNAFHEAAIYGDSEMIKTIHLAGGDPLSKDTNGNTPLSLVLHKGESDIKAVLGTNLNLCDSDGNTPVHVAVLSKINPQTMKMILDMNYPVNRRNSSGTTPLTLAISQNSIQLAALLLEYGADPYISDNKGECAISLALKGNTPVLDYIVKHSAIKTDISGEGILHYAARLGDVETVKKLVSMGLDKSQKSITGETAYDIAVRWQKPEIATLLQ